jgi:hypothetical protein
MKYKFTPDHEKFIRDNYRTMLYKDIAAKIINTENRVQYFCYSHNLRKQAGKGKDKGYVRAPIPASVKTGKHWPADHTNKDREYYVNYYLGL